MEYNGDVVRHRIKDGESIFIPSACCMEAITPSSKGKKPLSTPPTSDQEINPPKPPDLGSGPMILTTGKEKPVVACAQVQKKKKNFAQQPKKNPPAKAKYGGGNQKKPKLVWVVKGTVPDANTVASIQAVVPPFPKKKRRKKPAKPMPEPKKPKVFPRKKKSGQVSKEPKKRWVVKEENGLRFKPSSKWLKQLLLNSMVPKGTPEPG